MPDQTNAQLNKRSQRTSCVDSRLRGRRTFLALAAGLLQMSSAVAEMLSEPDNRDLVLWSDRFAGLVDRRLEVPKIDQDRYLLMGERALTEARLGELPTQAILVIDRCAQVQAGMVVVRTMTGDWRWLGASAVSTGKIGSFEHFLTPLGVFAHTLDNPDYRAEGTFNKNHIRGYGLRGRRVFDFGWQDAERGWGGGGISKMRLQMHATDPQVLEARLGNVASEGCIRIPATLNVFLDMHGVLDAEYEAAVASGKSLWVLKPNRQPLPWQGRYMVIVDSLATERPSWSPSPKV